MLLMTTFIGGLGAESLIPEQVLPHILFVVEEPSLTILEANEEAIRFYGYRKDTLESMTVSQLDYGKNGLDFKVTDQKDLVVLQKTAKGETKLVLVNTEPLERGTASLYAVEIEDITGSLLIKGKAKYSTLLVILGTFTILVFLLLLIIHHVKHYILLNYKSQRLLTINKMLQAFLDTDSRLGFVKDGDLRYRYINKAVEEFYQKDASEIVGFTDDQLAIPQWREQRNLTDEQVLRENRLIESEISWNDRFYKSIKFPVELSNGKKGIGAYIEDITGEKKRGENDQKSLLRMAMLVDFLSISFESPQSQLDDVLEKAVTLTESVYGFLYLYDEVTEKFSKTTFSGDALAYHNISSAQASHTFKHSELWQKIMHEKKPLACNSPAEMEQLAKNCPPEHLKLTSFLAFPVLIHEKIVAMVGLANKKGGYRENDIYQISLLMTGVWNAKEKNERDRELQASRENLQLILDSTAEGIFGIDREGKCTFCNASSLRLLGYSKQEQLLGKEILAIIIPSKTGEIATGLRANDMVSPLVTGNGISLEDQVFSRPDGTSFDVLIYAYPQWKNNQVVGSVITFTNNTERKQNIEKIQFLSSHDELTGVYNRSFFEQEKARIDKDEYLPISLIVGDVNGLKLSNDIFGHIEGDFLLKNICSAMQNVCKHNGSISRTGGDEFVVLLPHTGSSEAKELLERIKTELDEQFPPMGKDSISLGYATKTNAGENLQEVFRNAENSMYMEKTLCHGAIQEKQLKQLELQLYDKIPEEKLHSKCIAQLCGRMAELLQLEEIANKQLIRAGYLHDIGKVVKKKGNLSETAIDAQGMHRIYDHTVVGFRILKNFDETAELAEIILYHHEHWDGTGYPKQLKGKQIPLASRILRFCETYEMLSQNKERDEKAMKESLSSLAGTVLDPNLVDLYIESGQPLQVGL
ncbi:diguanylate cyclase (GGDEF) domain-containing protein,uncharacterized domain HDIG-containing protein [Sphaerochaeta pleomorpha str. Grapes]|uniref:Diguanylate cyclase (GGDEF) domain-containing protein,uncharacterized domain HDIG-containing protein n=2 Tax=Sphaerochaeta TaxID=399320 RepID=G8QQ92_SPHPG|nr:diguanylate cyclase (GGDEF) domain-containing protein,uncharacterized domain HDIG-containing protein [Sphaerochaeta pleomorpha str. Grapes]